MGACKTPIPTFVLFVIIYEKYPDLDEKSIQVKFTDSKGRKGQQKHARDRSWPEKMPFPRQAEGKDLTTICGQVGVFLCCFFASGSFRVR